MAAADFTAHQGDAGVVYSDTLVDANNQPVSLAGSTVTFVMRSMQSANPVALTGTATVTSATSGGVSYTFTAADLGTPGLFMASWVVKNGSNQTTYPLSGYRWVSVEQNLTTVGGQQLVSLPDAKDYLNLSATDRAHDAKIMRYISAVTPLIEDITGPLIVRNFDEWHTGGQYAIQLRRRPSSAYGTSPVMTLVTADVYIGPIRYPMTQVGDPVGGSIYSVMLDPRLGTLTRRGPGGGIIPFPAMPSAIHVTYAAGQATIPANVYEAALELLRVNYQTTQAVGRGRLTVSDTDDQTGPPMGFTIPRRVKELLAPNRRHPSIA